jgi:hypothetical protein
LNKINNNSYRALETTEMKNGITIEINWQNNNEVTYLDDDEVSLHQKN